MSAESDFEDAVMICEFYADPYDGFSVDYESGIIVMDGYTIEPLFEKGELTEYLVMEPGGASHLVWDPDSFFQRVFAWKEYV